MKIKVPTDICKCNLKLNKNKIIIIKIKKFKYIIKIIRSIKDIMLIFKITGNLKINVLSKKCFKTRKHKKTLKTKHQKNIAVIQNISLNKDLLNFN